MAIILDSKSLYYNDVNLIAQPQSNIQSRNDIDVEMSKVIIAPMDAVVGERFAIEALNDGLTVCYPRFASFKDQKKSIYKIYDKCGKENIESGYKDLWVSVGLNDIKELPSLKHKSILIDVANGYLSSVVQLFYALRADNYRVMVGNVHSSKGFNLYNSGRIRVGIGQGSVCKTGSVSGYTRGQVTEILDCFNNRYSTDQKIIADGGIQDSGYAAKAFGIGADYVMMGGYFKCAEEAKNIINKEYSYWGGASERQQLKHYGKIKRKAEGREINLNKKDIKPLKQLIQELKEGLASAISYSGYANLTQFIGNGVFEIKHNSLINKN